MKKKFMAIAATAMCAASLVSLVACGKSQPVVYKEVALAYESYGYCVKSGDALLSTVNSFLATIKENGTLDNIIAAEENGTATSFTAKTSSSNRSNELVVATNAEFEPFEYKDGDKFAGIDMQVAKLLAESMGKELVIIDMDFEAVILSVGGTNATCDIGMAGLTISNDRSKNVTFSVPYYQTAQWIAYAEGDETFKDCTTADEIVAAINALPKGTKAGGASGQTGEAYIKGSEDFGYTGFSNITVNSYKTVALAVKALSTGKVKFVVADCDTIKSAVEQING